MHTNKKYLATLFALALLPGMSQAQDQDRRQDQGHGQDRDRRQDQDHRQRYANSVVPRIDGFNVDEVQRIVPGVELDFSVYGTPGGSATIHIDGARRNLVLTEVERGQYEGTYTVGNRDQISARSPVTANLRVGNQVTTGVLSESLLKGVGYHAAQAGDAVPLKIERFDVRLSDDLAPGRELEFSLRGTPGAKVGMTIDGTKGVFFLPEVRTGEYAGSYTIKRYDRIAPNSSVRANLRQGERVTSIVLGKPLLLARAPAPATPVPRPLQACGNCASVEAINVVEVNGDGNYLGTIGGGVVGALLGSQVGNGNGRTAAEIAGAVGGAYAGRNIDRRKAQHYEVVVRYANGGTQTVSFDNDPGYRVGDKVRVNNGTLSRD